MVDKDHAPVGRWAVAGQRCKGCMADGDDGCDHIKCACAGTSRPDGQDVIFVQKPHPEALALLAEKYLAQFHEGPGAAGYHVGNFIRWVKEQAK